MLFHQRSNEGRPGKLRILIVSQHPLACESLCRLLERESHGNVEACAASNEGALLAASHFHPDIALIDMALPTRLGIETALALKVYTPTMPMVVALLMEQEKPYSTALLEADIRIMVGEGGHGHELLATLYALWEKEQRL